MKKGLFITLEGGEGAGKSTQMAFVQQRLQDSLQAVGKNLQVTREAPRWVNRFANCYWITGKR